MVYVDPRNLGYKPYWERWLKSRSGEEKRQLGEFFVQYVEPQIKHITEGQMGLMQVVPPKTIIPQTGLHMVRMFTAPSTRVYPKVSGLNR
jgi:dynein heavy chain